MLTNFSLWPLWRQCPGHSGGLLCLSGVHPAVSLWHTWWQDINTLRQTYKTWSTFPSCCLTSSYVDSCDGHNWFAPTATGFVFLKNMICNWSASIPIRSFHGLFHTEDVLEPLSHIHFNIYMYSLSASYGKIFFPTLSGNLPAQGLVRFLEILCHCFWFDQKYQGQTREYHNVLASDGCCCLLSCSVTSLSMFYCSLLLESQTWRTDNK